jgi:hypothetical protein
MKASVFDISQIVIIGCFAFVGDFFAAAGLAVFVAVPIVGIAFAAPLFLISAFLALISSALVFMKLYITIPELKNATQGPGITDPVGSAITILPWVLLGVVPTLGIVLPLKGFTVLSIVALTNSGVQKIAKLVGDIALTIETGGASVALKGAAKTVAKNAIKESKERVVTAGKSALKGAVQGQTGQDSDPEDYGFRRIEKAPAPKIPEYKSAEAPKPALDNDAEDSSGRPS